MSKRHFCSVDYRVGVAAIKKVNLNLNL